MFGVAANVWAMVVLKILSQQKLCKQENKMNPRSSRQDVPVLLERLTSHFALLFPSVLVHVVALKMGDSSRGYVSKVRSLCTLDFLLFKTLISQLGTKMCELTLLRNECLLKIARECKQLHKWCNYQC